ncbi:MULTISPECIES: hypothetical protein [Moorena]|nr:MULTISPECIES: hypothetical protein [Moorena]
MNAIDLGQKATLRERSRGARSHFQAIASIVFQKTPKIKDFP